MHSISTKTIIETFQEYFSISSFGRKHKWSFYNVLVFHKLYKVCVTQGQDENYIPGSQNFLRPKFHLNLLRCRCKYSKPFSNSYKTLERSVTKVRHWELLWIRCNTLVAWQRLHVVLISRQKELYVVLEATKFDLESDEVLCSPPRYLNCKLNGKLLKQRSFGFPTKAPKCWNTPPEVSMIIIINIRGQIENRPLQNTRSAGRKRLTTGC